AADLDAQAPLCVDIRDRAGWSQDEGEKTPKIAALLAHAALPRPAAKTLDVVSDGVCLILGRAEVALAAAERLAGALSVTCLTPGPPELTPGRRRAFDAHGGRVRAATGALGRFELVIDGFEEAVPAGRGALGFRPPRDGARSECDVILDLRGDPPLFPAHEKRDGYLRADPGDPNAVAGAVFDAAQLVGTFEKPLHIRFTESLCAHSRAQKTGCTRCLDLCPTGAIAPAGDAVSIDPYVCAGCGACAAVCPSGAAAYDDPPAAHVFAETRAMASAYRKAGGRAPRLLVHDDEHGAEMIALAARLGRGLPADVVPLAVSALGRFGHAEALVALADGFAEVVAMAGPKADRDALGAEITLAAAIAEGAGLGAGRVRMIEPADPDAMSDMLFDGGAAPHDAAPVMALGGRREATRMAAKSLAASGGGAAAPIALPDGAPYGAVVVNEDACTLCLACASLCPSGALTDNPDKPQLRFQEDACLQCGLCAAVCPEDAIALKPRLDLSDGAYAQKVMREEEPFE
ncbi:MAG: 4Fe-4S binding protein, partial [Pseudomonadota bacterium]